LALPALATDTGIPACAALKIEKAEMIRVMHEEHLFSDAAIPEPSITPGAKPLGTEDCGRMVSALEFRGGHL
jgi:hypothetical protein